MKIILKKNTNVKDSPSPQSIDRNAIPELLVFTSRNTIGVELVHSKSVSVPRNEAQSCCIKLDESVAFFSVMNRESTVLWEPNERHDGIWFVLGGSISYANHDLNSGDWIFVPRGKHCSVTVASAGATVYHCRCSLTSR